MRFEEIDCVNLDEMQVSFIHLFVKIIAPWDINVSLDSPHENKTRIRFVIYRLQIYIMD